MLKLQIISLYYFFSLANLSRSLEKIQSLEDVIKYVTEALSLFDNSYEIFLICLLCNDFLQ